MRVAGRILTALVGLFLIMNGVMTALRVPHIVQSFTRFRYTTNQVGGIGVTLLACTAIYFIPRTAVLGAILLTGYLGGAAVSFDQFDGVSDAVNHDVNQQPGFR